MAAGCDGRHDDLDARSSAAGAAAMLPGTRDSVAPQAGNRAQGFDMQEGASARGASDALLPPVMHTAD
ncbi:hypothetical protein [Trinickia diaoshuihuensis]|uniref:hypothetical protein n=1 Tax=Trinickia diaoshuihuensis TaxID=2292265 RepID=UPI0013C35F85|nr:hypothetical protein [Trinickia diaoshuihuensis]